MILTLEKRGYVSIGSWTPEANVLYPEAGMCMVVWNWLLINEAMCPLCKCSLPRSRYVYGSLELTLEKRGWLCVHWFMDSRGKMFSTQKQVVYGSMELTLEKRGYVSISSWTPEANVLYPEAGTCMVVWNGLLRNEAMFVNPRGKCSSSRSRNVYWWQEVLGMLLC